MLRRAAERGDEAVVRTLLAKGVNIEDRESTDGERALCVAAGKGHETIVKSMFDHGAVVDAPKTFSFRHKNETLFLAVSKGN